MLGGTVDEDYKCFMGESND